MLIGHQKQWQFLKKSAQLGRIPHGILFYGEEQLGKKTLAIEFAKFINCSLEDSIKKPCQTCQNCRNIQKASHPDLILIEPLSSKKEIQISQIRELILKLSLRSYSAPYKIAIIDKAHSMTQEAQNCFLKLLEEPRGRTILIITTEYPETLLPTIISRIQKLKFSPVKKEEIKNYIISKNISKEEADYLTSISFGRPGLIVDFLSDLKRIDNRKEIISDLIKVSKSDLVHRFQYAKGLVDKKSESSLFAPADILNIWLEYFRDIFLSRFNKNNQEEKSFSSYSLSKLTKIISLIQSTKFLLSTTNINPKLAFELLLMEI